MTTSQPQPVPAQAANTTPPRDPEASRLLRLWVELTHRAASAAAHRSGDETSLRDMQLQVEDAITDRFPDSEALMAELWVWEVRTGPPRRDTAGDVPDLPQGPPGSAGRSAPSRRRRGCVVSIANIAIGPAPVTVTGESLVIHDLTVTHAEAASFVRSQLSRPRPRGRGGPGSTGTPGRTGGPVHGHGRHRHRRPHPDARHFRRAGGREVDGRAGSLDQTLTRLHAGEESVARTASAIIEKLPEKVDAALAGQAANVRTSVVDATRTVQAAGPAGAHRAPCRGTRSPSVTRCPSTARVPSGCCARTCSSSSTAPAENSANSSARPDA